MQPTAAPWARKNEGGEPPGVAASGGGAAAQPPTSRPGGAAAPVAPTTAPWIKAGDAGAPMAPTAAPWAKPGVAGPGSSAPLPAVSRGELTKAPWAAVSGPALTGRPVEAAVPRAQPRLPSVPSADFSGHAFVPAAKRILSTDHLKQFLRSDVACDLVSFILALNKAVKGKQLSDPCEVGGQGCLHARRHGVGVDRVCSCEGASPTPAPLPPAPPGACCCRSRRRCGSWWGCWTCCGAGWTRSRRRRTPCGTVTRRSAPGRSR